MLTCQLHNNKTFSTWWKQLDRRCWLISFGGGGGSSGITAHFHNSAIAGEGGSLKMANGVNTTQFTVGAATTNIPFEATL